jgi:hypothetical protein
MHLAHGQGYLEFLPGPDSGWGPAAVGRGVLEDFHIFDFFPKHSAGSLGQTLHWTPDQESTNFDCWWEDSP